MSDIHLNDFKSFERYLFDEYEQKLPRKKRWAKYYQKEKFIPPINDPKTTEEFQLDHYALWMVISVFRLKSKPAFHPKAYIPIAWCYACECDSRQSKSYPTCNCCPLVCKDCGWPYALWAGHVFRSFFARLVAHYKWED